MTCYANSIFQVLAQTPHFLEHLKVLVHKFNLDKETFTWRLLDVLNDINMALTNDYTFPKMHATVSTEKMRQLVGKIINSDYSFHIGRQNDSHSFLITVFNAIKSEITGNFRDGVLSLFEGTFVSKFKYFPCKHFDASETQMFSSLLIPVDDYDYTWDIKDGIRTLLQEERFHNNELPCDRCIFANKDTVAEKQWNSTVSQKY